MSQALGDLLTPAEVDQVMRRREDVLAYLDALVAERGYDKVVVEDHAPPWCQAAGGGGDGAQQHHHQHHHHH